jgi:hypothetical protein
MAKKNTSTSVPADQKTTSTNVRDLARSVSPSAPQAPDYPLRSTPLVLTLWAADGDKAELQRLGFDFDNIIWRFFDIQPMAKYLRPKGKVAGKEGSDPQYKLIEASEEFNLRMTSQINMLASHLESIPRTDRDPVQHCAVDDAFNTVRLTGLLMEDFVGVDLLSSLEEASPPEAVWPPEGLNTRILSIDTYVTASSPRTQADWYTERAAVSQSMRTAPMATNTRACYQSWVSLSSTRTPFAHTPSIGKNVSQQRMPLSQNAGTVTPTDALNKAWASMTENHSTHGSTLLQDHLGLFRSRGRSL